jgi:hypothetical protein
LHRSQRPARACICFSAVRFTSIISIQVYFATCFLIYLIGAIWSNNKNRINVTTQSELIRCSSVVLHRSVCCVCSSYCMREFEVALHHNITVLRKKRLVMLMLLPNLPVVSGNGTEADSSLVTDSLRQYLRQYTYVDCSADDWFTRFHYSLPINGMLDRNQHEEVGERRPLLGEIL